MCGSGGECNGAPRIKLAFCACVRERAISCRPWRLAGSLIGKLSSAYSKMDSLFSGSYVNTQPLRKFEPLIRYDSEGNPQPKKPLNAPADFNDQNLVKKPSTSAPLSPVTPKVESKSSETSTNDRQDKSHEDLKRKVTEPPPSGSEPKKKQQKQQSIMSFFKKC